MQKTVGSGGRYPLGMAPEDLFSVAAGEQLSRQAPLAERLRPVHLDDIVGQDHLLARGGRCGP